MLYVLDIGQRATELTSSALCTVSVTEKLTPMEIMIIIIYIRLCVGYIYRCLDDVGKSKTIVN